MAYEIEKDVPMPVRFNVRKYPFARMEVGDSFFASKEDRANVLRATTLENRKGGARFATRTLKDGSGLRVWRTE